MNTIMTWDAKRLPNLVSYKSLEKPVISSLKTPVTRLNPFLQAFRWHGQLSEWGVPSGSIARLLPAMAAKALDLECLWVSDQETARLYPNSWTGLGFNLNNLHFLQDSEPLTSLRTVITENTFPFLIIDCKHPLQKSDLHFLAQTCRQQGTTIFLFRHFYLSNKNGNPFSQQRINSSYSITQKNFQLSVIKGRGSKKNLRLNLSEVLCG